MQILHPFEGDGAAAVEEDVLAAVEFGHLVMLVAQADQRQVAAALDFAADLGGETGIDHVLECLLNVVCPHLPRRCWR